MKSILNEVISNLKSEKDGYCRIKHKRGWLDFLEDGELVFKPRELHQVLRQVIGREDMKPRGNKLFFLRKRYNFTVTSKKKPYRTEEALERFITASNPENFFNQLPMGGRKESTDIGIEENESRFVFVELKPWLSKNSPLYAVVESLKNLIEYRIIHEKNIKHDENCKHYNEVDLTVLAPEFYYQKYGLIDDSGLPRKDKISILKKALTDLSSEFCTNISLMDLTIKQEDFLGKCKSICEDRKIEKQQSISISKVDAIPELTRRQWKPLVSSGEKNEG